MQTRDLFAVADRPCFYNAIVALVDNVYCGGMTSTNVAGGVCTQSPTRVVMKLGAAAPRRVD